MLSLPFGSPDLFSFRGPFAEAQACKGEICGYYLTSRCGITGKIWLVPFIKMDITVAGQRGILTRLPP
ncbi:hypothetical protein BES34_005765 [Leptospira inadai serovar Lyme]|uniref:Uncharacterized protein n=1 Tax=Leptospira inadai serovar Lyme TaxID=293084 RepID=A0ABX4YL83_9LEPT|nr:hypothetical protein BES34_005765 [Leptospira inadai serovar Lyme]